MVKPHPRHPSCLVDSFLCHPVTHSFKTPNWIARLSTGPQRTKIESLPRNLPTLATLIPFMVILQAALRGTMVIFRPGISEPPLGLQICSRIPFFLIKKLNNHRRASIQRLTTTTQFHGTGRVSRQEYRLIKACTPPLRLLRTARNRTLSRVCQRFTTMSPSHHREPSIPVSSPNSNATRDNIMTKLP